MSKTISSHFPGRLLMVGAALLFGYQAFAVQAGQSSATNTVKGRAPVASAVGMTAAPAVNGTVSATYTFSDADNDADSTTAFQWYRNGAVLAGATGRSLLLNQSGIGGDLIAVQVTPGTNPASTDPSSGAAVRSADSRLPADASFARFITPTTQVRAWSQADAYCTSLGGDARLPTRDELQQLFADATRSPTFYPNSGYSSNSEMCSVHGWPLNGQCGGSSNYYWSSTPTSAGYHYSVGLTNGNAYGDDDSLTYQVACLR